MKKELEKFDKKTINEIQSKYRIIKKNSKSNYFDDLRQKTEIYQKALFYKKQLDAGKIEEKDIPSEYVEEIRKIYYDEINKLKILIKSNMKH